MSASTTAQTASDKSLSDSVKNSLDSVAEQTPTQSVTDQVPSAQQATDALKAGASSLVAGLSSIALGVSNAATKNSASSHPESEKASDVDDFHVPGAFESATSDREDIADVQRGLQSVSDTLPSTQGVKESIPGVSSQSSTSIGNLSEQAHTGARSVQGQVQQGADYVRGQLPGSRSEAEQIHKDGIDHIKGQLEPQGALPQVVVDSQNKAGGAAPLDENVSSPLDDGTATTTGSRALPQVVVDSQQKAGGAAPLDENVSSPLDDGTATTTGSRALPQVVVDSQQKAGGAAPLDETVSSPLDHSTTTTSGARPVPKTVIDSQKKADVGPEASANVEAVREKNRMEQELKQEVPRASAQTANNDTAVNLRDAVAEGLAAAGTAAAGVAAYARQKTTDVTGTDPVSVLSESTQQAIDGDVTSGKSTHVPSVVSESQRAAGVSPEASANPAAVLKKVQLEAELQREVEPASSGQQVLPQSAQRSVDENTPANTTSYPHIVGDVGESTSGISSSLAHPDLHSGVHNNVVGDHLDDAQTSSKVYSAREPTEPAIFAHIPSFGKVDLKAGVHNGVVGSGSNHQS